MQGKKLDTYVALLAGFPLKAQTEFKIHIMATKNVGCFNLIIVAYLKTILFTFNSGELSRNKKSVYSNDQQRPLDA